MVKMLITLLNFCLLNPVQDKLTYKIKYPVYKREANDKPYTGHDPLYANWGLAFEQTFQNTVWEGLNWGLMWKSNSLPLIYEPYRRCHIYAAS